MSAGQEKRYVCYDRDLKIEAYHLNGTIQRFPNHFHEYYVIGFVENGKRHLSCKGREYDLSAGDMVLFNPQDNHSCAPVGGEPLDYRAVNIAPEVMQQVAREAGMGSAPCFTQNVVPRSGLTRSFAYLYSAILSGASRLKRKEAFFSLLNHVFQEFSVPDDGIRHPEPTRQIQALCAYIEAHFVENITLDELLSMTSFGKSYLLRSFTKQVGVSPYRYLQTVRLERAKTFLREGVAPIDAANMAGFCDQSHFTNFFKGFVGLTPKQYQRVFTDPVLPAAPPEE